MKKKFLAVLILALTFGQVPQAQTKPSDSLVIRVGEGSKVIFAIKDKKDLETLKQYDFQALVDDMIAKLENKDTTKNQKPSMAYLKDSATTQPIETTEVAKAEEERWSADENTESSGRKTYRYSSNDDREHKRWHGRRTYHSFNMDLGTNNYLSNGVFPDATNELVRGDKFRTTDTHRTKVFYRVGGWR